MAAKKTTQQATKKKKVTKKTAAKKASGTKRRVYSKLSEMEKDPVFTGKGQKSGPGIIGTIVECLQKKPCTKAEILAVLVKRFPDRTEKGMRQTINCQVPTRLRNEKGLKITRDDEGRYSIKK